LREGARPSMTSRLPRRGTAGAKMGVGGYKLPPLRVPKERGLPPHNEIG